MNLKRAFGFGAILWLIIFFVWSVLILIPVLMGKEMLQYIIYWILLVPIVLFLAKWYFKEDPPSTKKGFLLGVTALILMSILDITITVPLFIIPKGGSYATFYASWMFYAGLAEVLVLTIFAGWEFDRTYTKFEDKAAVGDALKCAEVSDKNNKMS